MRAGRWLSPLLRRLAEHLQQLNARPWPADVREYEHDLERLRGMMPQEEIDAEMEAGGRASVEEALALASAGRG